LGVNIQEGFYSFESDTWWNYSNKGVTTDFFKEHYDYELRDFNFNQFNLNSQEKGKDVKPKEDKPKLSGSKIPQVGRL